MDYFTAQELAREQKELRITEDHMPLYINNPKLIELLQSKNIKETRKELNACTREKFTLEEQLKYIDWKINILNNMDHHFNMSDMVKKMNDSPLVANSSSSSSDFY